MERDFGFPLLHHLGEGVGAGGGVAVGEVQVAAAQQGDALRLGLRSAEGHGHNGKAPKGHSTFLYQEARAVVGRRLWMWPETDHRA